MQTNREDVGKRYEEILISVPPTRSDGERVSEEFSAYCAGIDRWRAQFVESLAKDGLQYVFMSSAALPDISEEETDPVEDVDLAYIEP